MKAPDADGSFAIYNPNSSGGEDAAYQGSGDSRNSSWTDPSALRLGMSSWGSTVALSPVRLKRGPQSNCG
jgi:hypothetical protein